MEGPDGEAVEVRTGVSRTGRRDECVQSGTCRGTLGMRLEHPGGDRPGGLRIPGLGWNLVHGP